MKTLVIFNKHLNERKLFKDLSKAKQYIASTCENNFELISFANMTDEEKIEVLKYELQEMESVEQDLNGSGRTYHNQLTLSVEELRGVLKLITNN